jgi:hypothetical protein
MRLPRLQFTLWRLMLVVAIVGLAMGGGVWGYRMWRLSHVYELNARRYRSAERLFRELEAFYLATAEEKEKTKYNHLAAVAASTADYHAARVRKYERAARYPWLAVESDPSEPWLPVEGDSRANAKRWR